MWISLHTDSNVLDSDISFDFNKRARVIEDLYNRFLAKEKLQIKGVTKIVITLVSRPNVILIGRPIKGLIPIARIDRTYDFHKYESLNNSSKSLEILNVISDSINILCEELGWDADKFENAKEKVIELNFTNSYYEIAPKLSRDKKHRAGVKVDILDDGADISLIIEEVSSGDTLRLPLIKTHPNRMFIKQIVSRGKWIDNNEYSIENKSGEIHFKGLINTSSLKLSFTPIESSESQLIDDLLVAASTTGKEQVTFLIKNKIDNLLG